MRGSGIFKGHGGLIQSRWRLLPPMVSYRLDGGAGIGKTNRGDGMAGKYLSGRVPHLFKGRSIDAAEVTASGQATGGIRAN